MIRLQKTSSKGILEDFSSDLTPLLDILFILLLFFMLTSGAILPSLRLNLPSGVSQSIVANRNQNLLEIKDGAYALNGKIFSDFQYLKHEIEKIAQKSQGIPWVIASDKNASIELLLNVLWYLQSKEIHTANILMKKKS